MTMNALQHAATTLAACAVVACTAATSAIQAQRAAAPARSKPSASARRFVADSFWVGVWERGGQREDDFVVEPRAIKIAGDLVVVLDWGTREVIGLDARTGATRFVKAASGTGPGEFKRPNDIVATTSTFGVLDDETSRISMFQTNGALLWDATLPSGAFAESLCAPTPARVLGKRGGTKKALILIDSSGRTLAEYTVPMPEDSLSSFRTSGRLVGPTSTGCVLVPKFGGKWFVVGAKGVTAFPFIDPGPEPTAKEAEPKVLARRGKNVTLAVTDQAVESPVTRGAMVRGDTLIIRAMATTPPNKDVYDYYHVPSGRYLHSRRPYDIGAAWDIGADGVFYVTIILENDVRVWALKPSSTPPAKKAATTTSKPPASPAVKRY